MAVVLLMASTLASTASAISLSNVVSRKTHGSGSAFDLPIVTLPTINGAISIEPRAIGVGHLIVFTFGETVTAPGSVAVVDAGNAPIGTAASPVMSGNEVRVSLTNIPDRRRVTVTLTGVTGASGTMNASASLGFLIGDFNNSASVSAEDISAIKAYGGQAANANSFRFDVGTTGLVSAADIAAAKSRVGLTLGTGAPQDVLLTVSVTGDGAITSSPAGINCGATCSANFGIGDSVTLAATPASGNVFTGWSGACSGTGSCTVSMTMARSVTAAFASVASGPTYYFSDCQTGAAIGCLPGSNANPGTQAAPKRDLTGINVDALPAGSRLLFARGGAWDFGNTLVLENMNVSAALPLVFDAYGSGPLPTFSRSSGNMFHLGGNWNNTSNDGGYTFRNIKFDGRGTAVWGFWFVHTVRDVVIENSEITGFAIGINSNDSDAHGVRGITLRNNNIHHNYDMGMLGHYNDLLIEGNLIEANNFSGSGFSHGTYLGGGNNITIRNNRYLRNSVVNGVCQGGNMTFHGQIDGLLIEGNTIEQDAAAPGCWLMSITRGYVTPEWFRNAVVRNNRLINGGNTGIAVQSAPGIVVEGNVAINTQSTNQTAFAIGVGPDNPTSGGNAGDVGDTGAIVRNNTACQSGGASGAVVTVNSPGGSVSGNVVITGAAATTGICAR